MSENNKRSSGNQRRGGNQRGKKRQRRPRRNPTEMWEPKTRLGTMVKSGQITSMEEVFQNNYVIKEEEIVDVLLPKLKEEVVNIKMVQRQSDAGQQSRFQCTVVVGNEDGYIGVNFSKNVEIGPGIRQAINKAKLKIIPIKRGCGSWECNCGGYHSIPFKTVGKGGSVEVTLYPAPKGTGLACSDSAKVILKKAGITDVWIKTKGNTKSKQNMVKAVYDALGNMYNTVQKSNWS